MGNLYITPEGVSCLRNLRSRKRIAREDHEKFLRECCDRHAELEKQRRNLPLVPFEKPYQKGYVRFFVLREDVRQGKQADFAVAIEREFAELDKIINDHKNWGIIHSKIYGGSYSWRQYQKRYEPKEKYKRTPLKEITALKYHSSAMEIGEMLLEYKPYVQL